MAILCGIDIETTGTDPKKDKIIEVGMVLWEADKKAILSAISFLVDDDISSQQLPSDISHLTGIDSDMLITSGRSKERAAKTIALWMSNSNYIVAHNTDFEKEFLAELGDFPAQEWIDTMVDLPYKPTKGSGSLSDITLKHGLFNPMPHRALTDVIVMMQLLGQYDFLDVHKLATAPSQRAEIRFGFDKTRQKNDAVKAIGFHWDGDAKCWHRKVRNFESETVFRQATAAGFEVTWQ